MRHPANARFTIAGVECAQRSSSARATPRQAGNANHPVIEDLRIRLQEYHPPQPKDSVSRTARKGISIPDSASWILREACRRVGIEGVSTIPSAHGADPDEQCRIRRIQEISGIAPWTNSTNAWKSAPNRCAGRSLLCQCSRLLSKSRLTSGNPLLQAMNPNLIAHNRR